ncbi:MAG: hypothetical protein C0615_01675 [Desulfuromonas sp.]|nr:MAG: hypothetical protein C0615_01675 [Desulfuromonas sp.]
MRPITSLNQAMLFSFVLVAALPVALFALMAVHHVRTSLVENVARENLVLAKEIQIHVENYLSHPVAHLSDLRDHLAQQDDSDLPMVTPQLQREVGSSEQFEYIYLLTREGEVIASVGATAADSSRYDYYSDILSLHDFFDNEVNTTRPVWSDVYRSDASGEPVVNIALPLNDIILVGTFNLNRGDVDHHFNFSFPKEISFALMDRNGWLITSSIYGDELASHASKHHLEIINSLHQEGDNTFWVDEDSSLLETAISFHESGWTIWVGRDQQSILAPIEKVRSYMMVTLVFSILVGLGIAFLISKKMMRPISSMVNGLNRLAEGNYEVIKIENSYKEVDDLAAGFNLMSLAVIERESSIRERETRFRNLVNSIEGIVWEYDLEKDRFVFVSEHSVDILGSHPQQWLDTPDFWKTHIHPDDRQWVVDYLKGLSENKLSPQLEYRMLTTEGETLWVRNMVNISFDSDRPARLYGVLIDITNRKNFEIELRNSETRFRSLVEQAADAIIIHDDSGRLVEVNDQACISLGCSREELLEMSILEIEATYDSVQLSSIWTSVRYGNPLTMESRYWRKDGSVFPVEIRLGSFSMQNKTLFLALVRDISERKKADAALRESEERYRSVVTTMREGVVLFDHSGKLVASNPATETILKKNHAELVDMLASEGWSAYRDSGRKFPAGWNPVSLTLENAKAYENIVMGFDFDDDGEVEIWLEVNTRPVRQEGSQIPSGVVMTLTDVTEKRKVMQALKESEEQVRLLLDSTAEGIYGVNGAGECTFCNSAGLELLGYEDEKQVLGKNMHQLIHHSTIDGDTFPDHDCSVLKAFSNSTTTHVDDEVFWRADGSWFYVEYWAHPIVKGSKSIGSVVNFHDITERRQMQQQSIRTAQLASLGELAAGVAHEINNPINGVINYAQILLNRLGEGDKSTELANRIIAEGERIATIVKDLLFFAREGGPEIKPADIGEVLAESLSLTEAQIRKEGILLNIDIEQDMPPILTRAQQVQQLFLNILSNARHALNAKYPGTHEGKTIDISMRHIEKEAGGFVRCIFRDSGIGIPAAMLEKVMNPFITTKPAGVGTGLGLSISHEIVKNHGGDIRITSQEGEWTEVTVDLPMINEEEG